MMFFTFEIFWIFFLNFTFQPLLEDEAEQKQKSLEREEKRKSSIFDSVSVKPYADLISKTWPIFKLVR